MLSIAPGAFVPYRVSFSKAPGEEIDTIVSQTQLIDSEGNTYVGTGYLTLHDVISQMGSLTAFDPVVTLSPEEIEMIRQDGNLFFEDARGLFDDRMYHQVAIEDQIWGIPFHYQGPRLTLFYEADEEMGTLWLHAEVSGFEGMRLLDLPKEGADDEEAAEEEWDDEGDGENEWDEDDDEEEDIDDEEEPERIPLPTVRFPVDLSRHRFLSYYSGPGITQELIVPRPIVFEKVDGPAAEPNPLITFQPHA